MTHFPAKWQRPLSDGRVACELCPRACLLSEGQVGACRVRRVQGGELIADTFARGVGFAVDPVEKKPVYHFYPGSSVFSFGTPGCNLACVFCQNWGMSRGTPDPNAPALATPEVIASKALSLHCKSVAFTYNDPTIWAEYAIATAEACHDVGLQTIAVSAGYISPEPRREFYAQMDAANIDLKFFSDANYQKYSGVTLAPILETLEYVANETKTWLEVTTLLILGVNDGVEELRELTSWFVSQLGPDVPLHFSAFYPAGKMLDRPATPIETLLVAREIAREAGLRYVYLGNVRRDDAGLTRCPSCSEVIVERLAYQLGGVSLSDGKCDFCGETVAGRF